MFGFMEPLQNLPSNLPEAYGPSMEGCLLPQGRFARRQQIEPAGFINTLAT